MSGAPAGDLPVLRVRGSHRDVGRQLGEACAATVRRAASLEGAVPRHGRSTSAVLAAARAYREATARWFPWILAELDGAASGAGADPEALFAASIEELWESRPTQPATGAREGRGCTDVAVGREGTRDGHVLVAHNNDLPAATERDVVAVEWDIPGEPRFFSLGVGPWVSVGWNDAGLSVTGNEVRPNDERPGVPRLLLVRAQLRARTLEEAVGLALHPARASAYNTVYAHRDGGVVDVEASATAAHCTALEARSHIVHTNHYVADEMTPYEEDPACTAGSRVRLGRARELLERIPEGRVEGADLRAILSDHANEPDSICRHEEAPGADKTVFWCVADVTAGRIAYGRGNPCRPGETVYAFSTGA